MKFWGRVFRPRKLTPLLGENFHWCVQWARARGVRTDITPSVFGEIMGSVTGVQRERNWAAEECGRAWREAIEQRERVNG